MAKKKTTKNTGNLPDAIEDKVAKYGRVDVGKALKLRLTNNLSYAQIGAQLNCSDEAVRKRLKPFLKLLDDPQAIKAYQDNKATLLTAAEMELLNQIVNDDKIKKASLNNVAYAFGQISQQGHLARGEATSNVNFHVLASEVQECEAEIERLQRELEGD